MLATILDLITSLLKAIPFFNKWFSRTEAEKNKDIQKKVDEESENMKDTGRPKW